MKQLIDSTQLDGWFVSTRRDAQELLPQLIRRLILATVPTDYIQKLNIPVGDEILLPGYDGEVQITSDHPFVPKGTSVWEMGTGNPREKANKDYIKRTKNPGLVDKSETSFVFATPKVWRTKEAWVQKKKETPKWKDISVLDAVNLSLWLEMSPAVARWLAGQIGIAIHGIRDLDLFFKEEVVSRFGHGTAASLVIGGRSDNFQELRSWLDTDSRHVTIYGESIDEAALFVAATLASTEFKNAEKLAARTLFVHDVNSVDHIASLSSEIFLVALNPEVRRRAAALDNPSLRVIFPCSKQVTQSSRNEFEIVLDLLDRRECAKAICELGYTDEKASRIARESKGSLLALSLLLLGNTDGPLEWAVGEAVLDLLPLIFVGQWDSSCENDCKLVEKIANRPYDEVERIVFTWASPRGPLVRRENLIDLLAGDFSWKTLAPSLNRDLFSRYADAFHETLTAADPKLDLPPDERWAAELHGKRHPYSKAIRSGLVNTLVRLGIGKSSEQNNFGEDAAAQLVRRLFDADGDELFARWYNLAEWLPEIAEAVPSEFLKQFERFASSSSASKFFEHADSGLFSSSPHVYILSALQKLAWAPEYLTLATAQLGALAVTDPSGSLANRSLDSLIHIFLPWFPNTSANVEARLAAIDYLHSQFPDVATKLCLSLLPDRTKISSGTAAPQWREWKKPSPSGATVKDYWAMTEGITSKLLCWLNTNADGWAEMLESYPALLKANKPLADKIFLALSSLEISAFSEESVEKIGNSIRRMYTHHRQFPDADWSMSETELDQIQSLYEKFAPQHFKGKFGWLFTAYPELPERNDGDFAKTDKIVEEERIKAVAAIHSKEGLSGLLEFAKVVERPDCLGRATFRQTLPRDEEKELLRLCLERNSTQRPADKLFWYGNGYLEELVRERGVDVVDKLTQDDKTQWNSTKLANLGLAMPDTNETWEKLAEWGSEVEEKYWKATTLVALKDFRSDCETAVRQLLRVGRAHTATNLLGACIRHHRKDEPGKFFIPEVLMASTLTEGARQDVDYDPLAPSLHNIRHDVERILEQLQKMNFDDSALATLELLWFSVLPNKAKRKCSLYRRLSNEPAFFIELLKLLYRAESEEEKKPTAEERSRASQAYELLQGWGTVPGAVTPTSGGDEIDVEELTFSAGEIDPERLDSWVGAARSLAKETGYLAVCDEHIGQIFAYSPTDTDGTWPNTHVRNVLETTLSDEIESGLSIGVNNRRGVLWRGKGGTQERRLAEKFEEHARNIQHSWPRTANVLRGIASDFERQARYFDRRENSSDYDT